ncbi:MAG: serine hydrolase [Syntrophales bacterium]
MGKIGIAILGVVFVVAASATSPLAAEFLRSSYASRGAGPSDFVRDNRKPVFSSASVLVKDQLTGELLLQKQVAAVLPIASITKLMTAMVVLDTRMSLLKSLTIEASDVDTLRHSSSHLPVGTRLTRGEALLLALMASENRAAHALGRNYPGGLNSFVTAMNAKARSLGLTETHFEDPAGLSSGNVSSARDLVQMVDAAYSYHLIREFTTREATAINCGRRKLGFCNSNRLIRSSRWQIGLSKTGYIDEAGHCLVMQANVGQRPLLIVLLDAQGKLARFSDANRIRQWIEGPTPGRHNRRG